MQIIDYVVSGIWKDQSRVNFVMLHLNTQTGFETGRKVSSIFVIDLIKKGSVVFAIQWNYQKAQWTYLAPLEIIRSGRDEHLRCKYSEGGLMLENLINMNFLGAPYSYHKPVVILKRNSG
jgi:hypothetical protein